jgi:hypothetical protein
VTIKGHGLDFIDEKIFQDGKVIQINRKPLDAMIFYFEDGTIDRIPEWSKYFYKLGADWELAQKKSIEKEIGKEIKTEKG